MNQFFEVIAVAADQKELKRVAQKYGVKSYHVEMTRTIAPFKDLIAVWKMYRFLKRENPHIVHSHTPKAGIVGMTAAWLARVPNRYHTVAGLPLLEATGIKRKVLNFVEQLTYRFATKVYPNSFELQKIILEEQFCDLSKLKVIGQGSSNGIDSSYFSKDQIALNDQDQLKLKLGIDAEDFVFIFVGRLVRDKGIHELVSAFVNSTGKVEKSKDVPNFKLLLVGPLEQDLDPLNPLTLMQIKSNPAIITTGYQEDVRPYFAISNALVFPSYREGFPNVVLQSLAMQVPAIVTNINGCREIITHDDNGLIVPVKDEIALQNAMEELLINHSLYENLKSKSRGSIAPYEQQIIWEALLKEYRTESH